MIPIAITFCPKCDGGMPVERLACGCEDYYCPRCHMHYVDPDRLCDRHRSIRAEAPTPEGATEPDGGILS